VRGTLQLEGIPLHVIDTAGLRETEDPIEQIGIERSWREIERADVVVLLVDARSGVADADRAILAQLPGHLARVTVHNKIDLAGRGAAAVEDADGVAIALSAKSGEGLELLRRALLHIAGWHPAEDVFIARERVGIDDLHAVLAHIASRRTLQRRLASMVEQQRIRAEVSIRLRTESSPSATASPVRPVTACRHWC
jgi:tRNA modification GTPase